MTEFLELSAIDPLDSILADASETAPQTIDPLAETLPTTGVKWENFERLLLRMGDQVEGLRDFKRFGSKGQAQKGIDVIGLDADGSAVAIQSKRHEKKFTKADFDEAIDKFLGSEFPFAVNQLIIGVACTVTERSIIERLTELNATLAPLHFELWDQERISELLRDQPQIVIEFFGTVAAENFCLPHIITPIEVPSRDAVAVADAMLRGPLRTANAQNQLARARQLSDTDPSEALRLYREVQEKLRAHGFPGHAAEFDKDVTPLLVRAGHADDARRLLMRKLWQSERTGDHTATQRCKRDVHTLLEDTDNTLARDPAWQAVAWAVGLVVESLVSPVPNVVGDDLARLVDLDKTDRARLLLLLAESGLGDDRTDRVLELVDILRAAANEVTDDALLQTRLLLAIADADGDWSPLVRAARISLPKDVASLVHARYARHLVGQGEYKNAQDEWSEAINDACLTRRHEDAVDWLYSQRAIANRFAGVLTDRWHPLAREIADLSGEPRLVTAARQSREHGLAALNAGRERSAAISFRRYLRDSIVSGALADERDARTLLGSVFMKSEHPELAAHQFIQAGDRGGAESAAHALGDTYCDVADYIDSTHQWIAAAALYFAAAQADLIPDRGVPPIVDSALRGIDAAKAGTRADTFLDPVLSLAAYALIAAVADRLTESQGQKLIDLLADHVTAPPNAGWHTDKSHVLIMAGVVRSHDALRANALEQLLGLFERESHWFGTKESQVLADNLDVTGPKLRELASRNDPKHMDAQALLALHDDATPTDSQLEAAADSLQQSTANHSGHYSVGTRAVDQSLIGRYLPVDDRISCIETLLANARSPYEGAENRISYQLAASNLVDNLPETQRRRFHSEAMDLARTTPMSEWDAIHASLGDPLGFMRWNGAVDSRPSALFLAARLAKTDAEQEQVRALGVQLATAVSADHSDIAHAILSLDTPIVDPLLEVLAAAPQKELRCAAAIMSARSGNDSIAQRLAADKEPLVRRTLANATRHGEENPATRVLREDPRWSVRRLVQPEDGLSRGEPPTEDGGGLADR